MSVRFEEEGANFIHAFAGHETLHFKLGGAVMPVRIVFFVVIAMSVASALAAIGVAVVVDTRERPAARLLVVKLMHIAVLGTAGVVAMLSAGVQE